MYYHNPYYNSSQKSLPPPQTTTLPAVIYQHQPQTDQKPNPNGIADYIITMSILARVAQDYQLQQLKNQMEMLVVHQELQRMASVQKINAQIAYQRRMNYMASQQNSYSYTC